MRRALCASLWILWGVSLDAECFAQTRVWQPSAVEPILTRAADARPEHGLVSISQSGVYVAFENEGAIWLIDTRRPGSSPTRIADGNQPTFSPDSTALAFWSSSSGTRQLWIFDLASRRAEQLTRLVSGVGTPSWGYDIWYDTQYFSWSPDSRRIVFPHVAHTGEDRSAPLDRNAPVMRYLSSDVAPWPTRDLFFANSEYDFVVNDLRGDRGALFVVDVRSHETSELTHGDDTYIAPSWSPDGRAIAALRRSAENRNAPPVTSVPDLVLVDAINGGVDRLSVPSQHMSAPRWSPTGDKLAFAGFPGLFGGDHLIVFDIARTTAHEFVAQELKGWMLQWTSNDQVTFVSEAGISDRLVRFDVISGRETASELLHARVDSIAYAAEQQRLVVLQDDPSSPTHLRMEIAGRSTTLFRQATHLSSDERPEYRPMQWRNSEGDTVDGMLMLPRRANRHGHPPVVFNTYPGGAASWRYNANPDYGVSLLLSQGYAVFWVNTPQPIGVAGVHRMIDDYASGIDALGQTNLVNAQQVCAYGHSNGGAALAQFLVQTNRIKAAVMHAPAMAGTTAFFRDSIWDERIAAAMGNIRPWEAAADYVEVDPLFRIDHVSAPVLLVVGRGDSPVDTVVDLFNGLRSAGKPAELLVYTTEHHNFALPALNDMWARALSFYAANGCAVQ